ncbi:MAG: hypothetical protein PHZ02_17130 [Desulfocapsaceae bacterium]|nr:hypothetical protein [Desulfocapsaceae bacterium]
MEILCVYCGDLFEASPRHKNQIACKKPACQRARKAEWQRRKMRTDPVYSAYQKISQKEWARTHPGYWKTYRKNHPEKADRNRVLQAVRNRKARTKNAHVKMETPLIAKMDASKGDGFQPLGQFWLIPVIAKMDALKVNIVKVPLCYP